MNLAFPFCFMIHHIIHKIDICKVAPEIHCLFKRCWQLQKSVMLRVVTFIQTKVVKMLKRKQPQTLRVITVILRQ